MKKTVNLYQFRDAFQSIRPNNFSYEGLGVLFEYLEQLEDDCGQELEMDVIGICCDYSEDTFDDICEYYSLERDDSDDEIAKVSAISFLEDSGALIGHAECEGTLVYLSSF